MVLEYLAPEVCQARHFLDLVACIELLVTGIAVGLEEAGEALQLGLRMEPLRSGVNLYHTSAGAVDPLALRVGAHRFAQIESQAVRAVSTVLNRKGIPAGRDF